MRALLGDGSFWVAAGAALALVVAARALDRFAGFEIGDGVPVVVGALAGLHEAGRLSLALVVALGLLACGARLARATPGAVRVAASFPGAVVLGAAVTAAAPTWTRVAAGAAVVVVTPLASTLDRDRPRLVGLLVAISALGVYGTVPDTEQARVLVAAALVGGVLGFTRRVADPVGTITLLGLLTWTVAVGGYPRPGSVVGGLACVGVLALGPVVRAARVSVPALLGVHVALVAVASRVAGLRERAWVAAAIAGTAYGVVLVVFAVARRAARSR